MKSDNLLNSLHPSIKFTLEKSKTRLPFLDTLVISENGKVQIDIYYKPTNSKQYLLYNHVIRNIQEIAFHTI